MYVYSLIQINLHLLRPPNQTKPNSLHIRTIDPMGHGHKWQQDHALDHEGHNDCTGTHQQARCAHISTVSLEDG